MAKRILVTGAGGFIGGFIVAAALSKGYETWAAVRKSTNREFLTDPRIHFIELDFTDGDALKHTLREAIAANGGKWDFVVHNLGATKAANYIDFERINCGYMQLLVETLKAIDAVPEHFLLMSSLSVMGMGDDKNYTPFHITDAPYPNTRYGMSKAKAENYLLMAGIPYTIFRCTGVYGPHERDYFLMMKSIASGFDFSVGFKKQMLTFIYVKDLARAVMCALEAGPKQRAYFISEDKGYTQKEFRQIVLNQLHKKFVVPITCPICIVKLVCMVCTAYTKLSGKPTTLNLDKFKILRQRNWLCDTTDTQRDLGFQPEYDLEAGVTEAIAWYKEAGWL